MNNPFILKRNKNDNDVDNIHNLLLGITKSQFVENNNIKRILCHSAFASKKCSHDKNCVYAHSYNEQKQDPYRKIIYDIIKTRDALDDFSLIKDKELYATMVKLTNVCSSCINKNCVGGYNCKFGVFSEKYQICYDDLYSGNCKNINCVKKL